MFEQKKTKQDEQKTLCSLIESPEVGANASVERILEFVHNDTRSQSEIFDSLKERILRDAAGALDEQQAIEATRNLLDFFSSALKSYRQESDNNVDLQYVNGNVEDET
ncbi:MAG: hypothetical protein H6908_03535 [Hyphomicrobiales bacterium]|nr:hypothetical protein [Hyphomicrobiales bacterium]